MSENEATTEDWVSGPHRVDTPHPELTDGLANLWGRVATAGGAVGFGPADPVEELHAAAKELVEEVTNKRVRLITLGKGHVLVGAVALRQQRLPVQRHTAQLLWLLVDPDLQGQGWEQQLHDAALAQAQALGLEKLELSARGGSDLAQLLESNAWVERGRWSGAVRLADGEEHAEVWFARDV